MEQLQFSTDCSTVACNACRMIVWQQPQSKILQQRAYHPIWALHAPEMPCTTTCAFMQPLHLCLQEKLMPISSLSTFQRAAQRDAVVKRADAVLREVSLLLVQQGSV